ncbi:MAG: LysM peptidoglycan-binding domain-containing protein [Gemmatimonadetes bacterium]|nr:LysM peptidoglycan-binding domain-containing protein [Gemmatimonadota bacterium]
MAMTPARENGFVPSLGAFVTLVGVLLAPVGALEGQSLLGSQASLDRQDAQAGAHDYTLLRTSTQLRRFVEEGYLIPIVGESDFELVEVSFPFARPEVKLFVERLASQYRTACGEKLVVTSLTRPLSLQPANASDRSVHPAGMAVDLRRSSRGRCRAWLEPVLLSLEAHGVVEATRERNPPHYHVAVFPRPYARYVQARTGSSEVLADRGPSGPATRPNEGTAEVTHQVTRGETLSEIAVRYGTSVARLRTENGMSGDLVRAGQRLRLPVAGSTPVPVAPAVGKVALGNASAGGPSASADLSSTLPSPRLIAAGAVANSRVATASEGERSGVEEARHRVRPGESLWTISAQYGVTEDLLRAANGIRGSRIVAGQTLVIPLAAVGSGVLRYTVRSGDSLSVIASRLGTTVDEIREQNGMNATRIYAGQTLDVPLNR